MILSIDPGETVGIAVLDLNGKLIRHSQLQVVKNRELNFDAVQRFLDIHLEVAPEALVIEDYRVYASKAMIHIGKRILTAELIGAIELFAARKGIITIRLAASHKGRWPPARLWRFFPETYKTITKPHAFDAWVLGLCYLELYRDWSPLKNYRRC